jgi:ketosteroid isomerase-like protein
MPNDTAQLLQQFYAGLNSSDLEAVMSLCDQHVEVYMPPDQMSAVAPRGQKRVADYLHGWLETWDDYRAELEDFREVDHRVIAFIRARARGKGSRFETETENADIFTLQDGKITHLRLYVDRDEALREFPTE